MNKLDVLKIIKKISDLELNTISEGVCCGLGVDSDLNVNKSTLEADTNEIEVIL